MDILNHKRAVVQILQEVCEKRQIKLNSFSDDWIFCLQANGKSRYVFGYDFGLNNATAKMICKDKAATSDLLEYHGISRIEHRLFHGPQLAGYVSQSGNWQLMLDYLKSHPRGVVCKPNEGTGGNSVHMVKTQGQLESAVYSVFAKSRSLCLSPLEDFAFEYRVAVIDGTVPFAYRKRRPCVLGDGTRTIRELVLAPLNGEFNTGKQITALKSLAEMKADIERIPSPGEEVLVNWRHNLGQGASPELIAGNDSSWPDLAKLAQAATSALDVRLASVDIACTASGLKILEINSGIMMESLAQTHTQVAKDFYDQIISALFK